MGDKTIVFGKYIIRVCILLYAPLFVALFAPSFFMMPTIANEPVRMGWISPSNVASLSASLKLGVENYLPTNEKTLRIKTDNARGYRVLTDKDSEKEVWSIVPEYASSDKTIKDIIYMQEMTPEICDATPTPKAMSRGNEINVDVPEATLIDVRDNSTYRVRKLADGKCWMSQNLRLNLTAGKVLTSNDTDIPGELAISNDTQSGTGVAWGSEEPTEAEVNTMHSYSSHNTKYGVYYNWYAATAGTGTYYMQERTTDASICPKGWQLPKVDGRRSFDRLLGVYGLKKGTAKDVTLEELLTDDPLSIVLAGDYYNSGVVGGQGEWGDYWTADAANLVAASFDVESGKMNYNHKSVGMPIRCVAR